MKLNRKWFNGLLIPYIAFAIYAYYSAIIMVLFSHWEGILYLGALFLCFFFVVLCCGFWLCYISVDFLKEKA